MKHITSFVVILTILAPLSAGAYYYYEPRLYIPGVDSAVQQPYTSAVPASKPVILNFDVFGNSSAGSNTAVKKTSSGSIFGNLFGSVSSAVATDANGNSITLVSADNTNVYAIIAGKKHLIPSQDLLSEYNYSSDLVQVISYTQLNKYPTANLLKVKGDNKHTYFLTGNGMTRLIPSQKVMDAYGDREEDAITISAKEFNFYPQNQYIYQEMPLNRDIFQIIAGAGKRYLTPMAVQRLGITADQVAPVSQFEMDSYKILTPVIQ